MKKIKILILFTLVFSASCRQDTIYSATEDSLKKIDPDYDKNDNLTYLVIPNSGCSGCITTTEAFVRDNYKSDKLKNIRYIFTRISNFKQFKFQFGNDILTSKNILIDRSDAFIYQDSEHYIYPAIVYRSEGHISSIDYQSPESPGLVNLMKKKYEKALK